MDDEEPELHLLRIGELPGAAEHRDRLQRMRREARRRHHEDHVRRRRRVVPHVRRAAVTTNRGRPSHVLMTYEQLDVGVLLCTSQRTQGISLADSTFTFRVDDELKAAFSEVAAAQEHTAAQLLRLLMRDAVRGWTDEQAHDVWFRGEVTRGVEEADDPRTVRRQHDAVLTAWQRQRALLEERGAGRTA